MNDPTLDSLAARLDALAGQMAYLVERQRKQEELFAELTPILREVMATATGRLDELDKKGYFAFGRELLGVFQKIVEGTPPDDVRQLGEAAIGILRAVRALTQPEVLIIAREASEVLRQADAVEPIGIAGMVRASRDEEVQRGMAVLLEVLKHVGRGTRAMSDPRRGSVPSQRRARLAAATEAKRASRTKLLGIERPATRIAATVPETAALPPPAGCAVPGPAKGPVVAVLDGVGFTADGHLADPRQWTRELAVRIAAAQGVELTDAHWRLIDFARADFERHGVSPNVRRVTQGTGVSTKDFYALFPKAPARTVAKIAGIPKPAGCI